MLPVELSQSKQFAQCILNILMAVIVFHMFWLAINLTDMVVDSLGCLQNLLYIGPVLLQDCINMPTNLSYTKIVLQ